ETAPTLLISSIGIVNDVRKCQTIDFKYPEDYIYLLGTTANELGGSEYLAHMGEKLSGEKFIGPNVPKVDSKKNLLVYKKLERAIADGLVSSCISVERGGIAVALAKSAMAGMLGCEVNIACDTLRKDVLLFSESQGRIIVSVAPHHRKAFESTMRDVPCELLGKVSEKFNVMIKINEEVVVSIGGNELLESYRSRFKDF
ncbi:MAG: AIR synthase-related protein, partial [Spirochaetes bacterium]|nr:AIR synthase-related protein [Spirochaetota bacterium]